MMSSNLLGNACHNLIILLRWNFSRRTFRAKSTISVLEKSFLLLLYLVHEIMEHLEHILMES